MLYNLNGKWGTSPNADCRELIAAMLHQSTKWPHIGIPLLTPISKPQSCKNSCYERFYCLFYAASLLSALCVPSVTSAVNPDFDMRKTLASLVLVAVPLWMSLGAQQFTFEAMFTHPRVTGIAPSSVVWSENGKRLAFLWNEKGDRFEDLYLADLSGKITRLTDMKSWPRDEREKDERSEQEKRDEIILDGGLSNAVWSGDGLKLYFGFRGDLFCIEPKAGALPERIWHTSAGEGRFSISRDGKWLAYTSGSDFFALETASNRIVQLTRDGSEDVINGGGAYDTYLEGAFWTPQGHKLAFVQYDVSGFERLLIPDYTKRKVEARRQQREIAGGKLPLIKVGIIQPDSAHKTPRWLKLPEKEQYYLRSLDWSPQGDKLALETMTRSMKERFILVASVASGKVDTVWRETDSCWVADNAAQVRFGPEGKIVLFASEMSGWCHLYQLALDSENATPRPLTSGEWEIEGDWTISEDRRTVLYRSSQDIPAERHLYCLDLPDGTAKRITSEAGWISSVYPTEDGSQAAVVYADLQTPADLFLCATKFEKPLRRLTTSPPEELKKYDWFAPEFVTIPTSDGKSFLAKLWRPTDVREASPIIVYIHGAGYAQNVDKSPWSYDDKLHRMLVEEGFVIVDIDYRGSSGYGRQWRVDVYRHLGGKDLDDAVDAAMYCARQGFGDSTRVGIWGWSYGGFLTNMAMFKRPDVFKVGCSVAAPNDWRNYNLWYTTQRFNFPDQDSVAYDQSSPITYAAGLQGKLLIVHGLQDDNVHAQDTIQLIDKLVRLGKEFDLLIYPREDHGFQHDEADVHVMKAMFNYFLEHLK